jgi:hypothetical protein
VAGDPAKATRLALQNAASVAGLLLTTEVMIAEAPKEEEHAHGALGGMGGMSGMDIRCSGWTTKIHLVAADARTARHSCAALVIEALRKC